jgi:hypothetical protein
MPCRNLIRVLERLLLLDPHFATILYMANCGHVVFNNDEIPYVTMETIVTIVDPSKSLPL